MCLRFVRKSVPPALSNVSAAAAPRARRAREQPSRGGEEPLSGRRSGAPASPPLLGWAARAGAGAPLAAALGGAGGEARPRRPGPPRARQSAARRAGRVPMPRGQPAPLLGRQARGSPQRGPSRGGRAGPRAARGGPAGPWPRGRRPGQAALLQEHCVSPHFKSQGQGPFILADAGAAGVPVADL